jgi:glycosyltransferase involved in cell wall biosynthesis
MPVYNAQEYLQRSVGSILNQTYKDFALLVYDDGSTDDSMAVIESFNDPRIEIIRGGENKGGIFARTQLINALDTEYCIWCDADDAFCGYYAFEKMVDAISKDDYDMVNFVNYLNIFPDGNRVRNKSMFHDKTFSYSGDRIMENCFPMENLIVFWSKIFSSKLLKKSIPEDDVLFFRTPQDDLFFFMMWWIHVRKYLHVTDFPSLYMHYVYIGTFGSKKRCCSENDIRENCETLKTALVSLYNRMTDVRPLSEREIFALLYGIGFGFISEKIRKTRKEGNADLADRLTSIFHEYFFVDGMHVVNGFGLFEYPDFIREFENIIYDK